MTPPKFHVGQKVRLSIEVLSLRREIGPNRPVEGTVLEILVRDGRVLYHVGGHIGDSLDDLWNADFHEHEIQGA